MDKTPDAPSLDRAVARLADPRTRREARRQLVAARAVGPLVALLDRGVLLTDVSDALAQITGQDFGCDVGRWRRWLEQSGDKQAPAFDADDCIRRAGQYLGVDAQRAGETYQFKLSLPGGRGQKVSVLFGQTESDGRPLAVIYSECGPAAPKHYEAVLRKNLTIPSGAFAVRDIGGRPQFVLVDTLLVETLTPGILAKHVENIAARADTVEKSLVREDRR